MDGAYSYCRLNILKFLLSMFEVGWRWLFIRLKNATYTWSVYSGFVSVHWKCLVQLKNKQSEPSGKTWKILNPGTSHWKKIKLGKEKGLWGWGKMGRMQQGIPQQHCIWKHGNRLLLGCLCFDLGTRTGK